MILNRSGDFPAQTAGLCSRYYPVKRLTRSGYYEAVLLALRCSSRYTALVVTAPPSFPHVVALGCRQAPLEPGYGMAGIQWPYQRDLPTVNLDARQKRSGMTA